MTWPLATAPWAIDRTFKCGMMMALPRQGFNTIRQSRVLTLGGVPRPRRRFKEPRHAKSHRRLRYLRKAIFQTL